MVDRLVGVNLDPIRIRVNGLVVVVYDSHSLLTLREAGHEDDEKYDETEHIVNNNFIDHDHERAHAQGGSAEEEQLEG